MKKIVRLTLILSLCVLCVLSFAGCDIVRKLVDKNDEGGNGGAVGGTDKGYSIVDMSANTYKGTQVDDDLEFANSVNVNNQYYLYYFKLGTIMNCPIYTSVALKYEFDTNVTFTFSSLTEESLETSFEKTTETIDTYSYTGGCDITVTAGLSVEPDIFGFKLGGVKVDASISENKHWTKNWGSVTTVSNGTVDTYLTSYSNGYSESVDFSESAGFKKGNYYRLAFYEELTVYGVIVYDIEKDVYYVTYQELMESNNTARVWEISEDGRFNYNTDSQLYFDVNKAVEYAAANKLDKIEKKLEIDLSSYYTHKGASLAEFSHPYYNNSTGIFEVYGSYNSENIDTYVFIGGYGLQKDTGTTITSIIDGFSIRILSEHDIKIVFQDMGFKSVYNTPAVYRDFSPEDKSFNDTICSVGVDKGNKENHIYANSGKEKGADCIVMDNVTITGNSALHIYGGNGSNGSNGANYTIVGGNGGDGGTAITCNAITIENEMEITLVGGNGGNGGHGGGNDWYSWDDHAQLPNGANGGNGGNGGAPINLTATVKMDENVEATLQYGNGGNGGNGGVGCNASWSANGVKPDYAGNGGSGGVGGNGYVAGAGGNGGTGGYSFANQNKFWNWQYGKSGDGGYGGNGGNSISMIVYRNGSIIQEQGTVGTGGRGGAAGERGTKDDKHYSTAGTDRQGVIANSGSNIENTLIINAVE